VLSMMSAALWALPTSALQLPDLHPLQHPLVVNTVVTLAGMVLAVGAAMVTALVVLVWVEQRSRRPRAARRTRHVVRRLAAAGVCLVVGSLISSRAADGYHYHLLVTVLRWAALPALSAAIGGTVWLVTVIVRRRQERPPAGVWRSW